jgi:hypothetical protein
MDRFRQLLKERARILEEIAQLGPMRRGTVYELRPSFTRKDGSRKWRGPYLTYTLKKKGKTHGKHLRTLSEAELYRRQIARFRRFEELAAQFTEVSERLADLQASGTDQEKRSES